MIAAGLHGARGSAEGVCSTGDSWLSRVRATDRVLRHTGKRNSGDGASGGPQKRLAVGLADRGRGVALDRVDNAFLDGGIPRQGSEEMTPSVIGVLPEAP